MPRRPRWRTRRHRAVFPLPGVDRHRLVRGSSERRVPPRQRASRWRRRPQPDPVGADRSSSTRLCGRSSCGHQQDDDGHRLPLLLWTVFAFRSHEGLVVVRRVTLVVFRTNEKLPSRAWDRRSSKRAIFELRRQPPVRLLNQADQADQADQARHTGIYNPGTGWGGVGPVYRADGRMSRLCKACSMTWVLQPIMRPAAKVGVNISRGMPQVYITTPA